MTQKTYLTKPANVIDLPYATQRLEDLVSPSQLVTEKGAKEYPAQSSEFQGLPNDIPLFTKQAWDQITSIAKIFFDEFEYKPGETKNKETYLSISKNHNGSYGAILLGKNIYDDIHKTVILEKTVSELAKGQPIMEFEKGGKKFSLDGIVIANDVDNKRVYQSQGTIPNQKVPSTYTKIIISKDKQTQFNGEYDIVVGFVTYYSEAGKSPSLIMRHEQNTQVFEHVLVADRKIEGESKDDYKYGTIPKKLNLKKEGITDINNIPPVTLEKPLIPPTQDESAMKPCPPAIKVKMKLKAERTELQSKRQY